MKAFKEYKDMSNEFWSFVKYISEMLGYTENKSAKEYTECEVWKLCEKTKTCIDVYMIRKAVQYLNMRSRILNDEVQNNLMDAEKASDEYIKLSRIRHYESKMPMNKQKGEMKQIAYFTAIINMITEKTIHECNPFIEDKGFDDDPRGLVYIWNEDREIIGATSRRFDGAYPSIKNPKMVWEIKEYYYATTFGSRVADGVYETQLDGYEFQNINMRTGYKVYHVLFIDGYKTWWEQGKPYLCRIIDALNTGLVDEVIVGKEVLSRLPELIRSMI